RSGEHVVLRGTVKTLRVDGLDGGAILDASGLRVESASVAGKIDGRSVFKLNAPGGAVMVSASVAGKSSVDIKAPGGSVRFLSDRARIEGGSTVAITARNVELRGDVNGIATKVAVNIPGNGSLKVAAIRGLAKVEYRVTGDGMPEVIASTVSPTATFHRLD
ncbi:MAG TPA: hypothetical protein VLM40_19050, partial [Gemmata sp.]|nr:hypothetical protein [Gemmata sp.]